jgi:RNA polymerase sigma factor (sigma-70 family)
VENHSDSKTAPTNMAPAASSLPAARSGRVFATTRWTVVLQAGGPTSEGSSRALEVLCRTYWYPLYSFARRSGVPPHDAEDLTQSFFAHLLERDVVARADRGRGRFRSFLLTAFKNYHANARAHQAAGKRGGGRALLSLDVMNPEERYLNEPRTDLTPEKLYDQKWAASMLEQVMRVMRAEYAALGKGAQFDVLRRVIWGSPVDASYQILAAQIGMTEGAFKVAVHRMRARFKECLRQEVAQTVASADEVDEEIRHLMASLGT